MEFEIFIAGLEKSWKLEIFVRVMEKSWNLRFVPNFILADGCKVKKFSKICVKHQNVQPVHSSRCFHQSSYHF